MTQPDLALMLNLAITQLIQLTALICLVGLANRLLAERAPRVALLLWCVVFAKALTPPFWSADFGLFSWAQATAVMSEPTGQAILAVDWSGGALPAWGAAAVLAAWGCGSLLLIVATYVDKRRLTVTLRRDEVAADHPLLRSAHALAQQHGLRAPQGLVISNDELGPAVAGVRRPVLILPASLVDRADDAELRPIILHELVHADRRDTLTAALLCLVRAVWWFHPLVWWAAREADRLVERCVDVTIVRDLGSGLLDYARGLVRVLELRSTLQTRHDLAGLRPCQITIERLEFLRRFTKDRPSTNRAVRSSRVAVWTRRVAFATLAATLLPALPTDALQPRCELPLMPCADGSDADRPQVDASLTTRRG